MVMSAIGRMRNVNSGRTLKPQSDKDGYFLTQFFDKDVCKRYRVHRIVAQEFLESPDHKSDVDHIDHDPKNNFVNNLRYATKSENKMNMSKQLNTCSSTFKGASWHKQHQMWRVVIGVKSRRQMHIDYFVNEEEAARACNAKAVELVGEFADLSML